MTARRFIRLTRRVLGMVTSRVFSTPGARSAWKTLGGFALMRLLRLVRAYRVAATGQITNPRWPDQLPLLSVVVPCFNYGQYIDAAIESVVAQTFKNLEILVVDGGSTDGATIDLLRNFKRPGVHVYFREGRHFVGDNRNFGISLAKGKYICCLDADDLLKPTYFEKALFVLEALGYDVVYPSVQSFGESDEVWIVGEAEFIKNRFGNDVSTVAVFRKDAWTKTGGYHDWGLKEDYVYEDWDFWTRLLGYGFRFRRILEPLMMYRVHTHGLTAAARKSLRDQRKIIMSRTSSLNANYWRIRRKQKREFFVRQPRLNLSIKDAKRVAPRILFALPYLVIGGADTIYKQLIRKLTEMGWDVSIITTENPGPAMGDSTAEYQMLTKQIYKLSGFLQEREYYKFIFYLFAKDKFDVVYQAGSTLFYRLLPSIKSLYPSTKIVDQIYNEFAHLKNNRRYSRNIDRTIVPYMKIKHAIMRDYGGHDGEVNVIVHGVNAKVEFNPAVIQAKDREELGIGAETFVFGYFGRFSDEKQPILFVEMIRCLAFKGLDIKGIMTGDGPLRDSILDEIARMKIDQFIYAPGFVDDIRPLMKITDVIVLPSRIEGIPISIMEAFAMGVPAIASNVGGIPEIVVDGSNGVLCFEQSIEELQRKAVDLYYRRDAVREMGRVAREYALTNLDIDLSISKYLNLFTSLTQHS